jgi:hypothetical protein
MNGTRVIDFSAIGFIVGHSYNAESDALAREY